MTRQQESLVVVFEWQLDLQLLIAPSVSKNLFSILPKLHLPSTTAIAPSRKLYVGRSLCSFISQYGYTSHGIAANMSSAGRFIKQLRDKHSVFLRKTRLSFDASAAVLFNRGCPLIIQALWKSPMDNGDASNAKTLVPPQP